MVFDNSIMLIILTLFIVIPTRACSSSNQLFIATSVLASSSCDCLKNFLAFDLPDKMVELDPITGKVNKINPQELGTFLKEITVKGGRKFGDNYTVRVDFSNKNATVTQPGIVPKGTQLLDRARNAIKAKAPQPNIYQGSGMFCILSRKPDQQISTRHPVHLVVLLEEAFFGIHNMSQVKDGRFVEVAKVFVWLIENYKIGRSRLEFNVNGSQSQYGVHLTIASDAENKSIEAFKKDDPKSKVAIGLVDADFLFNLDLFLRQNLLTRSFRGILQMHLPKTTDIMIRGLLEKLHH